MFTGMKARVIVSLTVLLLYLVSTGALDMPPTLTLIDYSKPSTEPRLWVSDLAAGDMLFAEPGHRHARRAVRERAVRLDGCG